MIQTHKLTESPLYPLNGSRSIRFYGLLINSLIHISVFRSPVDHRATRFQFNKTNIRSIDRNTVKPSHFCFMEIRHTNRFRRSSFKIEIFL